MLLFTLVLFHGPFMPTRLNLIADNPEIFNTWLKSRSLKSLVSILHQLKVLGVASLKTQFLDNSTDVECLQVLCYCKSLPLITLHIRDVHVSRNICLSLASSGVAPFISLLSML